MSSQSMSAPVLAPELLRKIDLILEEFYPESVKAGEKMAKLGLHTSQIRGLQTLITSTSRFSEIINYIKNQAGKEKPGKSKRPQWREVAPVLLEQLEFLEAEAGKLGQGDPAMILAVKLKLARVWAKQVTAHYLFEPLKKKGDEL